MIDIKNPKKPMRCKLAVGSQSSVYTSADFYAANIIGPVHSVYDNQTRTRDSLVSSKSEFKKRIIVRVVTVFAVVMFLICFGMIALTLRMSELIDEKSNSTRIRI